MLIDDLALRDSSRHVVIDQVLDVTRTFHDGRAVSGTQVRTLVRDYRQQVVHNVRYSQHEWISDERVVLLQVVGTTLNLDHHHAMRNVQMDPLK